MTTAAELLARLRGHGVEVCADGDGLRYRPKDALTPALLAELRRHKWALLALLAADDPAVVWRVEAMRARHPRPWRFPPFLTVRDVPRGAGGCHSCGEPLQPLSDALGARCAACAHAARLVLDDDTSEERRA